MHYLCNSISARIFNLGNVSIVFHAKTALSTFLAPQGALWSNKHGKMVSPCQRVVMVLEEFLHTTLLYQATNTTKINILAVLKQ